MGSDSSNWSPGPGIEPGTIIDRRYEVISLLGAGAMGIVYKVLDRMLENQVIALKVLKPKALEADPSARRRIIHEVKIARGLSHPNIVRIYDIGETCSGQTYVSMEYLEASSLEQVLNRCGRAGGGLEQSQAEWILKEIVKGVAHAHTSAIVHRDLKPANVLVSPDGRIVKVVDFGLARQSDTDTGLTKTGETVGTPLFMAPEQFRGEKADARADVYALGIIAYQLVTGAAPFESDSYLTLALKHLHDPLPDVAALAPNVPPWFAAMIARAASKKKESRFASACDLLSVLEGDHRSPARLTSRLTAPLTGASTAASGSSRITAAVSIPKTINVPSWLAGTCIVLLLGSIGFAASPWNPGSERRDTGQQENSPWPSQPALTPEPQEVLQQAQPLAYNPRAGEVSSDVRPGKKELRRSRVKRPRSRAPLPGAGPHQRP